MERKHMQHSGKQEKPIWQSWNGSFMFFNKCQFSRSRTWEIERSINTNIEKLFPNDFSKEHSLYAQKNRLHRLTTEILSPICQTSVNIAFSPNAIRNSHILRCFLHFIQYVFAFSPFERVLLCRGTADYALLQFSADICRPWQLCTFY
jgi:hypothetical protein